MLHLLYAAPLQGITTWVWRTVHAALFGGADKYFLPFVSPPTEHLFTPRELQELMPAHNANILAVPQLMTRRAEDFSWAAGELAAMGWQEVNLNLGCPSGTVVAKGKGAGFLARPAELAQFFDVVFAAPLPGISVKTRLGVHTAAEFPALLELYNRYPLSELIVHPRIQQDFYKHPIRMESFDAAVAAAQAPLCYNGDLITADAAVAFSRQYPSVARVMAGRGLIADPALFRKLRGGAPASRAELQCFTQTLYEKYCTVYGDRGTATHRMKEQWYYLIHLFDNWEAANKRMRRVDNPADYAHLEAEIYRDLPLRTEALGPL